MRTVQRVRLRVYVGIVGVALSSAWLGSLSDDDTISRVIAGAGAFVGAFIVAQVIGIVRVLVKNGGEINDVD